VLRWGELHNLPIAVPGFGKGSRPAMKPRSQSRSQRRPSKSQLEFQESAKDSQLESAWAAASRSEWLDLRADFSHGVRVDALAVPEKYLSAPRSPQRTSAT